MIASISSQSLFVPGAFQEIAARCWVNVIALYSTVMKAPDCFSFNINATHICSFADELTFALCEVMRPLLKWNFPSIYIVFSSKITCVTCSMNIWNLNSPQQNEAMINEQQLKLESRLFGMKLLPERGRLFSTHLYK